MKRIFMILFLFLFQISAFSQSTRNSNVSLITGATSIPLYKEVRMKTHPTKGKFSFELLGEQSIPEAYQNDSDNCRKKIYAKGIVINGATTTDYDTVSRIVAITSVNKMMAAISALGDRGSSGAQIDPSEYDRITRERETCMIDAGWTDRIEKVLRKKTVEQ